MSNRCANSSHRRTFLPATILTITLSVAFGGAFAFASGPRALPAGQVPDDARLGPLKDLNGYFPFTVPTTREAWNIRAQQVRKRLLVSLGLWPTPERTPLEVVVHGRREMDGYTVEKVYFQSMPGFYVTGNLYRPLQQSGKAPGILCPHGHWANGRFYDCGADEVRKMIVQGAERFENGGRNPIQSRCVQLARMGCVVFHWDMIGYADSEQIPSSIIHGFTKQRSEMNARENWGLFSPQAESHLQSAMGLQTWNAIRALDFISSLPEVDSERIAVTGASGGGTQTFILCAVDDRPHVAMPAVMVSTAMQGGCTCENACCLRVGTGNVEIAALFAPKPQGLTAANDWTKEMETKGFPELKKLYELVGAGNNVMLKPLVHFPHNYNYVSRASMYDWFNTHLNLGLKTPIVEQDYERLSKEELTVWDDQHPRPDGGPQFERDLLRWWNRDSQVQLKNLVNQMTNSPNEQTLAAFRDIVADGVAVVLDRGTPSQATLKFEPTTTQDRGTYREVVGLLNSFPMEEDSSADPAASQEQLPIVLLYPQDWKGPVAVWISADGKAGLYDSEGRPRKAITALLQSGSAVCGVDLLYQGEFLADGQPPKTTRRVENTREAAAYTFGYNPALFAHRVQDVVSVVRFVRKLDGQAREVSLIGLDGAGPCAATALSQCSKLVSTAAVDTQGFRFGDVRSIHDVRFLPGGAKYLDLVGMMALGAPTRLWIAGEGATVPPTIAATYRAAAAADALMSYDGPKDKAEATAIQWLLESR